MDKKQLNRDLFFTLKIIENGDKVYYFAEALNVLFSVDLHSGAMTLEFMPKPNDYRCIVENDDCIYLFPRSKGSVCKYNIKSGNSEYIDIPESLHNENETNWSGNYIRFGNCIYFYWANYVLTEYDIIHDEWRTYRDWLNEYEGELSGSCFATNAFAFGGDVYFPIANSASVLKLNVKDGKTSIIKIPFGDKCYIKLTHYDSKIVWILTAKGNDIDGLYYYIPGEFVPNKFVELENVENSLAVMCCTEEYVFLLPGNGDTGFKVNIHSKTVSQIHEIETKNKEYLNDIDHYPYNFAYGNVTDGGYNAINIATGKLVRIRYSDSSMSEIPLTVQKISFVNQMLKESEIFNLKAFIEGID